MKGLPRSQEAELLIIFIKKVNTKTTWNAVWWPLISWKVIAEPLVEELDICSNILIRTSALRFSSSTHS
jgi:hypothetical protein